VLGLGELPRRWRDGVSSLDDLEELPGAGVNELSGPALSPPTPSLLEQRLVQRQRLNRSDPVGVGGQEGLAVVPDWRSVSEHDEGVHLTWAGFITADGCISDLGRGDLAMLRYWFSDRTLWLADVFGSPRPLAPPHLLEDTLPDRSPATVSAADGDTRPKRDLSVLSSSFGV